MPRFSIRMINSEFQSFDEAEFPSLAAARMTAIRAATKVVAESVAKGEPSVAVEVEIHDGTKLVARHVVTLSVADLSGGQTARRESS